MRNIENLKLAFPELEDSVKQSTKGGWGGYSDGGNGGGWWHNWNTNNPINLPPITITPSGPSYNPGKAPGYTPGGNPYWNGGLFPWGNPGYPGGGDGGGGGGGGGYIGGNGTFQPWATFDKDVVDVIEKTQAALSAANEFVTDAANIAAKIGDAEMASQAIHQLESVGNVLNTVGKVTMAYDVYNALSDGKVTLKEGTKLIADVVIGKLSGAIPVAGPIIAIAYTALDATGQVDKFIDWIYPDKLEDEDLRKIWDKMLQENITEGKTFKETFGRDLIQDIFRNGIHDSYPNYDPYTRYNPINEAPLNFII
jgi:hypothetical protein